MVLQSKLPERTENDVPWVFEAPSNEAGSINFLINLIAKTGFAMAGTRGLEMFDWGYLSDLPYLNYLKVQASPYYPLSLSKSPFDTCALDTSSLSSSPYVEEAVTKAGSFMTKYPHPTLAGGAAFFTSIYGKILSNWMPNWVTRTPVAFASSTATVYMIGNYVLGCSISGNDVLNGAINALVINLFLKVTVIPTQWVLRHTHNALNYTKLDWPGSSEHIQNI